MVTLKRKSISGRWLLLALFAALVAAILLMADATQSVSYFGRLHNWLLPINTLLLVIFVALIIRNISSLVTRLRNRDPGSKLTLRLVLLFVLTASMPVFIVYTFSIWLLERGVDSWFDVKVESALQDAVDLSRASLDLHIRTLRQQVEPKIEQLADVEQFNATLIINELLMTTEVAEVALFDEGNRMIASGNSEPTAAVPELPGESVLQLVNQGERYIAVEPTSEASLQIRMVYPIASQIPTGGTRFVQFLYPVSDRIGGLANNVQNAFGQYNELIYLRTPLKQNFILILTLVLALGALFAVFAAFYWSRVLVSPIQELAEGTKAVAAGEYKKKLIVPRDDDLGMLVVSFNRMTERLTVARDTAIINQRIIENQRTYLQTILEYLSSGVISLDSAYNLKTSNAAASQVLDVNLNEFHGKQFTRLGFKHAFLKDFCATLESKIKSTEQDWQLEIELFTPQGTKTILCKSVSLPSAIESQRGSIIVVDDVTALLQAQRDSAWGEVARRLAHEIKNPLTPIQLSAERLRRKLMPALQDEQSELVDRATNTIVQQVESMKLMVNDFSEYARMPTMEPQPLDINNLVTDIVELYKGDRERIQIRLQLHEEPLSIRGDSVRLRQVMHNLIKNAIEAMPDGEISLLVINTFIDTSGHSKYAGIKIIDNGPGVANHLIARIFDPYMTTKVKGNGLGLAIVKKIIEEHNGAIRIENSEDQGATVSMRFPLHSQTSKHPTHIGAVH